MSLVKPFNWSCSNGIPCKTSESMGFLSGEMQGWEFFSLVRFQWGGVGERTDSECDHM